MIWQSCCTFSRWQLERASLLLEGYGQWFPLEEEEIRVDWGFSPVSYGILAAGKDSYQRGRPHVGALLGQLAADQAKAPFLMNLQRNPERVMSGMQFSLETQGKWQDVEAEEELIRR